MENSERGKFEAEWKKAFDGAEQAPSEGVWNSISSKLDGGAGFETKWQKAFDGAEIAPSEEVWKAIDVSLVQAENASMKRRVVFYQRIAAASIIVLMLVSGYALFLQGDNNTIESIASSNNPRENNNQPTSNSIASEKDENIKPDANREAEIDSNANTKTNEIEGGKENSQLNSESVVSNRSDNSNQRSESIAKENRINSGGRNQTIAGQPTTNQLSGNDINRSKIVASKTESGQSKTPIARSFDYQNDPIAQIYPVPLKKMPETFNIEGYAIAYRLADLMPAKRSQKKKPNAFENQWASLGFGAGSYNSGVGGSEVSQSAAKTNTVSYSSLQADQNTTRDEKVKPGTSMSVAISAGKRFFKRWVLQGGISYMNQSLTSTASTVTVAPANQAALDGKFTNAFAPENTNSVTYTTESKINSNYQFLSVPVQAGYMIIDRKFGFQINGGVAPDFFLKSSVYDEGSKTETVNSATGTNDTFKSVSLAGLGGFELSYRFSKHYRISLVPGFRYSFTQVYKENSLASAKPFVADIGLRFRYFFNN